MMRRVCLRPITSAPGVGLSVDQINEPSSNHYEIEAGEHLITTREWKHVIRVTPHKRNRLSWTPLESNGGLR